MGNPDNLDVTWRTLLLFSLWVPMMLVALQLSLCEAESTASRFFAAFVALFAIGITPQIIGFSGFYQVWPWLTFAPFNTDLWLGPLLLLHLRRLSQIDRRFRNGVPDLCLLLPGILQTAYYSGCFVLLGDHTTKFAFNDAFHQPYVVPTETLLILFITATCIWQSFRLLARYEHFLQDTHSQAQDFVPRWMKWLFKAIVVLCLIWFCLETLSLWWPGFGYTSQYPLYLLLSAIVTYCSLMALSELKVQYPKMPKALPVLGSVEYAKQPQQTPKDLQFWQDKAKTLKNQMAQEQWYLEPDLTLSKLAAYLATNQAYLSRTINLGIGLNFSQLVNQYRIEHAKTLLTTQAGSDLLSIAYESGFNSKSTFNRIFKSIVQMTPSQYKEYHKAPLR